MNEPARILIIDDEQQILDSYKAILDPEDNIDLSKQGVVLFQEMDEEELVLDEMDEDDPVFSQNGYKLIMKTNGEDGVDAVRVSVENEQPIATAFIDMKMPGINGAETARRIWDIDPDIRIVFVTAFSEYSPNDINHHTQREDSYYLYKPFNPNEIKQFAKALTREWEVDKIFRKILLS